MFCFLPPLIRFLFTHLSLLCSFSVIVGLWNTSPLSSVLGQSIVNLFLGDVIWRNWRQKNWMWGTCHHDSSSLIRKAFVRELLWILWFNFTSLSYPVHWYVLVSKVISLKLRVGFHFSLSYFAYCHELCPSHCYLSGSFNLISPNPLQTPAVTVDHVFYRRVPLRHWCKRILNWK